MHGQAEGHGRWLVRQQVGYMGGTIDGLDEGGLDNVLQQRQRQAHMDRQAV